MPSSSSASAGSSASAAAAAATAATGGGSGSSSIDEAEQERELLRKIKELQNFHALLAQHNADGGGLTVGGLMNEVAVDLIDELSVDAVFEFHRLVKLGLYCPCSDPKHEHRGIVDIPGYDVFGLQPHRRPPPAFACPNCGALRQSTKFAPHLEKCMGMGGRESKRAAASRSRQVSSCFTF